MNALLKIVRLPERKPGSEVDIDLKTAPQNDNDPVLQNLRKAWGNKEKLPLLFKAVMETPTWQKLMPLFGTLADVLIDPTLPATQRVAKQKVLKEAIMLMWYSYMQSQKALAHNKENVGKSTIHIQLLPTIHKDRSSLKTILSNQETHDKAHDGLNTLSKRLIPLCASTISDDPAEQALITRFLTLVRQIISEVSYQQTK